jgi:hypothetical protein
MLQVENIPVSDKCEANFILELSRQATTSSSWYYPDTSISGSCTLASHYLFIVHAMIQILDFFFFFFFLFTV